LDHPNRLNPKTGEAPIFNAIRNQRLKPVDLLFQNGASLDIQNQEGETPLMIALETGNLEVVRFLMRNLANPFLETNKV